MFERFTPRARHVVVLAQEEARLLQHNYIGTEHMLLGLLHEGEGIGAQVLASFGLDLATARAEVLGHVGPGPGAKEGHIPFTPRAKKVLELALREALSLQHNYLGTEHLLLGLVREGSGVGAQIVVAHAPEPAAVSVRMAVLDLVPAGTDERKRRFRLRSPGLALEPDEPRTTPAAEQTIAAATRLAGARPVGSQHLLLAALDDPESAAARALRDLGVDLDRAKDALGAVDVVGTTDEAPEDAGRRQLRVRVTDDMVTVEVTDASLRQLARLALDAVATDADEPGVIRGEVPAAVGFGDVWLALRDAFVDIRRRATPADAPESG